MTRVLVFLVCFGSALFGYSQSCCSSRSVMSGGILSGTVESDLAFLGLDIFHHAQADFFIEGIPLEANSRVRESNSITAVYSMPLSQILSMSASLDFISHREESVSSAVSDPIIHSSGVGDLTLLLSARHGLSTSADLRVSFGGRLPVGISSNIDERTQIVLHPDLQPSFGAYGLIGAVGMDISQILLANLSMSADLSYAYYMPSSRYGGIIDFQFGDLLQLSTLFSYDFLMFDQVWQLASQTRVSWIDQNKSSGIDVYNSGGLISYQRIGLGLSLSQSINVLGYYELPIWRDLQGAQLSSTYTVGVSLGYLFRRDADVRLVDSLE